MILPLKHCRSPSQVTFPPKALSTDRSRPPIQNGESAQKLSSHPARPRHGILTRMPWFAKKGGMPWREPAGSLQGIRAWMDGSMHPPPARPSSNSVSTARRRRTAGRITATQRGMESMRRRDLFTRSSIGRFVGFFWELGRLTCPHPDLHPSTYSCFFDR